jgi:hypothetical protein
MIEVRKAIYERADTVDYMHKSRRENGVFMDNLVRDSAVGGILSQYLEKERIRTYIKDGVLRVYTKEKRESALPSEPKDMLPIVEALYGQGIFEIDNNNDVFLLRLKNSDLLLVAMGTLLKWETALRKALDFIAKSPGLPPADAKLNILLIIAVLNRPITASDREHLISALDYIGVKLHFVENGS